MVGEFSVDARDVLKLASKVKGADTIIQGELLTAVRAIGLDAERYAKQAAPVDRGQLRRSITSKASKVSGGAQAKVGTNLPYGRVVEQGRRPGAAMPPESVITAWARRHGIPQTAVYPIRRAIRARGIKARPFVNPAAKRAIAEGGRHLRPAIDRIRARLLA